MAVHLNARLNTRFIPHLIGAVAFVLLFSSLAHAATLDEEGVSIVAESTSALSEVSSDELKAVMSEGQEPARIDRRPGFSPMIVAPRPGERPTTGSLTARNEEEP